MSRITPLILAVALFMQMMDSTVIATSLPAIAKDIGTDPIALKLAMTVYMVSLAIFIPISGWVADRFGARNAFRWAILVFMLGSVACAVSGSLPAFVASRFLQGMGGAIMTPLARLVLVRSTPKKDLVSAMAWLTVPALVGPVVGPPVGGFLTTFLSWHWIFLVNLPIGATGIVLATIFLPRIERGAVPPIDWTGFILLGTAFAGVLFGLSVVSLPVLPPVVGLLIAVIGAFALILYVPHAKRVPHPLIDLGIFRDAPFRAALVGGTIFRIGMGSTPFLFPLMLQLGFGLTPFETGLIMLFGAVGAIIAKFPTRWVFASFGFRLILTALPVLFAAVLAAQGFFEPSTPVWVMVTILFLSGVIRSTFFTGMNAMAYAEIPDELVGPATVLTSITTQLAFALGVALAGGILEILTASHGGEVGIADFHIAFYIVGAVALASFIPFVRLSPDVGSTVSGHRVRRNRLGEEQAEAMSGD